jgi:ribosome biogenesis protein Nip4
MTHQWILLIMTTPLILYGEYRHRTIAQHSSYQEDIFVDAVKYCDNDNMVESLMEILNPHVFSDIFGVNRTHVESLKPSLELLRPLFGWAPSDTIKRKFYVTTQYTRGRVSDTLKQH